MSIGENQDMENSQKIGFGQVLGVAVLHFITVIVLAFVGGIMQVRVAQILADILIFPLSTTGHKPKWMPDWVSLIMAVSYSLVWALLFCLIARRIKRVSSSG